MLCVTGSPWHTAVCVCEGGGDEWRPTEQAQVPARQQLSGGVARPLFNAVPSQRCGIMPFQVSD